MEMRETYANTLIEFANVDKDIIVLEADLMSSISTSSFLKKFPDQLINCGIMEAHMMSLAAGLSLVGKKVFVHSFGVFATRRCFDQVFISLGYSHLKAVIIGSDPGVAAEHNGGTHMPFEDLGLMRLIPNIVIFEVSDAYMLKEILKIALNIDSLVYIRMIRKTPYSVYKNEIFKIGGSHVLYNGLDGVIFTSGLMVEEAIKARNLLKEKNYDISIIDVYSIKPLDEKTILEFSEKCKIVIVLENHNVIGGLSSAIASLLVKHNVHKSFDVLGVKESFGQVGTMDYLKEYYQIDAHSVVLKYLNAVRDL